MLRNRMSNVCDQFIDFVTGIANWLWDTLELVLDIFLEFAVRGIELVLAVLHLAFQVICFLRDLCIEALRTFAAVFRGFVNIVSSIKCEDVEDFATACIVVLLWVGAIKIAFGVFDRRKPQSFPNPLRLLAPPTCSLHVDQVPRSVKSPVKKKISQARKGAVGKRTKNTSVTSSSSESEDL